MHEGGGRWVGSNKVVELKKKKWSLPLLLSLSGSFTNGLGMLAPLLA